MNAKTKGGRPAKKPAEKLKYRVLVRLCTGDFYTLKARAKAAGLTRAEFARLAVTGVTITPRLTAPQTDHIHKLCGMANNLNQIARKANAAGYADARAEYLGLAPKIDVLLNELLYDR